MDSLCLYFNVYYFIYRMASSFNPDAICDEWFDPYCDLCFEDDSRNVEAASFCDDCVQFMCRKCNTIHKRLNSTRGHVVKTGIAMPRSQADKPHCSTGSVEDVSKSISSPETVSSTQLPHTGPAENFPAAAGKSQSARQSVALTQLKGRKLGKSPETVSSTQLPHTGPAENFPAAVGKSQSARQSVSLAQLKGRKLGSYKVKLSDDRNDCWIRGMAITNDSRRLLVDQGNKKVKLFSQDMKLLSSLSLSDHPRDIAVISDQEAVVTTDNESLVLLGISGSKMSINDTTRVPYGVWGISKYGEKLVVTSCSLITSSVKLIDKTGRVYWSVSSDDQGQSLFSDPQFVTSDIERSTVTVTDYGNNTLTVLNGDTGDVTKKRSVKDKDPRGVTTGPSGNIYVCYFEAREVAELTGDLAEERILLSKQDGLGREPRAIAYDKTSGQLITSYYRKSKSVDVWELS